MDFKCITVLFKTPRVAPFSEDVVQSTKGIGMGEEKEKETTKGGGGSMFVEAQREAASPPPPLLVVGPSAALHSAQLLVSCPSAQRQDQGRRRKRILEWAGWRWGRERRGRVGRVGWRRRSSVLARCRPLTHTHHKAEGRASALASSAERTVPSSRTPIEIGALEPHSRGASGGTGLDLSAASFLSFKEEGWGVHHRRTLQ
ncbi:hypothetical protein FB451DRAFT_1471951 [Mycena latifolia]|nr:hypothetical protein FB451DRAFT_1471951 [Mycena latifolia]